MNLLRSLVLAAFAALIGALPARAETVALFRVFLNDGTAVVSYGEYARVGDRIIFSMPIGAVASNSSVQPPLHVVNIPAAAVDWAATAKYAESVRYAHYISTTAESDYAALAGEVAAVLNAIVMNKDPGARLQQALDARRRLASWPRDHYGYRAADVREILGMLDEIISNMRAAAGQTSFALDLVADTVPITEAPPILLPLPSARESIAQAMAVVNITDTAADRILLLKAVVGSIDAGGKTPSESWMKPAKKQALAILNLERQTDEKYSALSAAVVKRSREAAAHADVVGVERTMKTVWQRDSKLGRQRPDEVNALLAQLQMQLDAARQLRLARDRWKERVSSYRAYLHLIEPAINALARAQRELENIKRLAGSDATDLIALTEAFSATAKMLASIAVPDELKAAHALLVSAVTLADSAVRTRRAAVMSGELRSAWDASSAAAGSMTLFARAQEDMEAVVKLPQMR